MEPQGSLPLSQEPATCPYPEPEHYSMPPIPLVEDDDMMTIKIIMCQTVV